jgi:hypothetical protein
MKRYLIEKFDFAAYIVAEHLLPRTVIKWALVRAFAHASRLNPNTVFGAITPSDVLKAWEQK